MVNKITASKKNDLLFKLMKSTLIKAKSNPRTKVDEMIVSWETKILIREPRMIHEMDQIKMLVERVQDESIDTRFEVDPVVIFRGAVLWLCVPEMGRL